MIVDHTQVEQDAAIRQIVALEADLFGHGAWSEHSVRQDVSAQGNCGDAPAILDRIGQTAGRETHALGGARRQCAGIGII